MLTINLKYVIEIMSFPSSCMLAQLFTCVQLRVTLWTVAWQIPVPMVFFSRKYWSGLPFPTPGNLPNPGIKPASPVSLALAGRIFTTRATWEVQGCRRLRANSGNISCRRHTVGSQPLSKLDGRAPRLSLEPACCQSRCSGMLLGIKHRISKTLLLP